ncbi:hypothetical protein LTR85_011022 [Meristemomyces frigidus]|nr:hypothetical protein LTR85_011022 [Meristemomyces frigidus]
MVTNTPQPVAQGLKNVFTDERYSDLAITCGDFCWKVHKVVVCTQSDFFCKACDGDFKKEAKECKIDLSDEGRDQISTMLHYLYHFDYDDAHYTKCKLEPTVLNVRMVMAGDKYFIKTLRDLAMAKLKSCVANDWGKEAFAEAIGLAYSNVTASSARLRSLLVDVVQQHAGVLFSDSAYLPFQKAAREQPEFLFDYAKASAATVSAKKLTLKHADGTWYQCPGESCKKYEAVFKVKGPIPRNWLLNCPMKCNMGKDQAFWKGHAQEVTSAAVSQQDKEGSTGRGPPWPICQQAARLLYASGDYSDLTIICNGREWKVHKFQLCAQSDFFHKACSGRFKEAQESKINLDDDNPDAVDALLKYLYHFDYNTDSGTAPLVLEIRIFAIADKYFIEPLKKLAAERFTERCKSEWNTAVFAEAVSELYTTAPAPYHTLKRTVVDTVKRHDAQLRSDEVEYSAFKDIVLATAALGADLFLNGVTGAPTAAERKMEESNAYGTWYECPGVHCRRHDITFCVRNTIPDSYIISCPSGCRKEVGQLWVDYKIEPPF